MTKHRMPQLLAALAAGVLTAQTASAAEIARILGPTDGLGGLNLTSYTNPWQNTIATFEYDSFFTSAGDGFNIYARGISQSVPFALADDSISVFPSDAQGIVDENDTAPFFGVTDTVNDDTTDTSGTVTAIWEFDISSATSDVEITFDLAAMGDFEADDIFQFSVALDGGALVPLGTFSFVDTDGGITLPGQDYTLANGSTVTTLDDPLQFDGTTLTNVFANFSLGIITGSANASTLTLQFDATTNGGDEALAFRNVSISEAGTTLAGDTDGDGDIDDFDLINAIVAYTGSLTAGTGGKTIADGDTDDDQDVDDFDLINMIVGYTGSLSAPTVPEPTSLALLGLGGLLIARRRRG